MEQKDIEILSALLSGELQPDDITVQQWVNNAPERQVLLSEPGCIRELLEALRLQQSFDTDGMWGRIVGGEQVEAKGADGLRDSGVAAGGRSVADSGHKYTDSKESVSRRELRPVAYEPPSRYNITAMLYGVAAGLFLGLTIWWLQRSDLKVRQEPPVKEIVKAAQLPNTNRAMLQAGGETVVLSGGDSSFNLGGNDVRLDHGNISVVAAKVVNYTLTTPRGANYQVRLPDGSVVWLNASSSITYPSVFEGNTREVAVSGEAYFDIAADASSAFIVKTGTQEIKVLGTAFNINNYPENAGIYTTLISGKVQVSAAGKSALLLPGEQAVYASGNIQTSDVDAAAFSSWKDGWIRFKNQPLADILATVSRWYDVDIHADKQQISTQYFTCYIDKQQSLAEVINSLNSSTNQFSFLLKEGIITVTKK
ncbi:FecR domain-containing protein [Chitinophaga sp. Cy-1792]|uniref:FecR domain-containing protein n=1 Tax=Chitinophaga sp. Cy-1792 TaxID=2608339 RepID=UPI0014238BCF|nr:FecR domain-containing protein [Chitinophaga sp. Cy-1792]NIG57117.1 DUF4974 domain-containing protein [Chitinophaga sp. Cy-1792]